MRKQNIAILTTVANFELYEITSKLFPPNCQKYVIDGREGMHGLSSIFYMFKKLKNKNIDWLIMADEDVIFTNTDVVFELVNKMEKGNYTVAGVRDGGVISHRTFNPNLINTFFSIINLKDVLEIWDKKEVKKNQYVDNNEFSVDTSMLAYKYDVNSLYEPYYCFYLWLKRSGKHFLYLDAKMHEDSIANSIEFKDNTFLYHTWHARSYGKNEKHTKRIDFILNENIKTIDEGANNQDYILYKAPFFASKQKTKKLLKKIKRKLKIS
ncbi:hypothetical protein [Olleya namhaensis]|uniref:hypothetical protein n=1 Tax=Olleya namhaensis TaxID=1144750 RepID=UPI002492D213|nr:hypothetical protein [Olleya namhaensis]